MEPVHRRFIGHVQQQSPASLSSDTTSMEHSKALLRGYRETKTPEGFERINGNHRLLCANFNPIQGAVFHRIRGEIHGFRSGTYAALQSIHQRHLDILKSNDNSLSALWSQNSIDRNSLDQHIISVVEIFKDIRIWIESVAREKKADPKHILRRPKRHYPSNKALADFLVDLNCTLFNLKDAIVNPFAVTRSALEQSSIKLHEVCKPNIQDHNNVVITGIERELNEMFAHCVSQELLRETEDVHMRLYHPMSPGESKMTEAARKSLSNLLKSLSQTTVPPFPKVHKPLIDGIGEFKKKKQDLKTSLIEGCNDREKLKKLLSGAQKLLIS